MRSRTGSLELKYQRRPRTENWPWKHTGLDGKVENLIDGLNLLVGRRMQDDDD